MGAETHAGPVGGLGSVREGLAPFGEGIGKLVGQMRVAAAVAAALGEAEMGLLAEVVNALRREALDGLRQALGEVGSLDQFRDLVLDHFGAVQDQGLMLNERPFDGGLVAIDVEALTILTCGVKQAADDAGADIGAFEFDVRGLDGEGGAVALLQLFAHSAGAKAAHVFGRLADHASHGADAVRGIPHRREAGPVVRPAVHVLLVGSLHELQLAQLALIELLLHEEVFAGIDDGLHHHVLEAGLLDEIADLFAVFDAGGHRHGAGDVFARLERLDAHPAMVGDGRVDV